MHIHLEEFIEAIIAERGATKNSVIAYKRDIKDFCNFYKNSPSNTNIDDIRNFIKDIKVHKNFA